MTSRVDPSWLTDAYPASIVCTVCHMLIQDMRTGCTEGHGMCRVCYESVLLHDARCPLCRAATSLSQLRKCRFFDDTVSEMQTRCKHGDHSKPQQQQQHTPSNNNGVGAGAVAVPSSISSISSSSSSSSSIDSSSSSMEPPRKARKQHATTPPTASKARASFCDWVGDVRHIAGHLDSMCELHLHSCIHAASGCGEQLTREGLLSHGDVCDYRPHKCTLCLAEFAFNTKSMHDDTACPSAAVSCNNTLCKTVVQRCDLQAHSDVCPWQVVACDSVGCTESYTRSDRAGHMTAFKLRHETLLADTAKQNVSDIAALKREVAALRADSLSHKNNFVLCLDHSSQLRGVSLETLNHSFFHNGPEVSCNARFLDETTIAVRVLNCSYQWNVSMHVSPSSHTLPCSCNHNPLLVLKYAPRAVQMLVSEGGQLRHLPHHRRLRRHGHHQAAHSREEPRQYGHYFSNVCRGQGRLRRPRRRVLYYVPRAHKHHVIRRVSGLCGGRGEGAKERRGEGANGGGPSCVWWWTLCGISVSKVSTALVYLSVCVSLSLCCPARVNVVV
jgi:hypothetical protein